MRLYEFNDPTKYLVPEVDPTESPRRSKRNPPPDVPDETVLHSRPNPATKKIKLGYAMGSKSALVGS
jgi:hypothetical protein